MCEKKYNCGKGIALIIILVLITAIVVIGLGFIIRGDTELLCGQNMELKADMDYLTESGLEHARGLILNPQDVTTDYWTGDTEQQLVSGSSDYYDVAVNFNELYPFNYQITSLAYRENGGQRTAQSSLTAELRLNPCIVYWQSDNQDIPSEVNITGDAYFENSVTNHGRIDGDVYSAGTVGGTPPIRGQRYQNVSQAPCNMPGISYSDFSSQYYYNGLGPYLVKLVLSGTYDGTTFPEPGADPGRVYYCGDDLVIDGNVFVNGTLVVKNDLRLKAGNLTIQSAKNFPALIIGHDLLIEEPDDPNDPNDPNAPNDPNNRSSMLTATGYTQIGRHIDMNDKTGSSIKVNGALYVFGDGIVDTTGCTVDISGMPHKACLAIWSSGENLTRWSPAAGAFYKSIVRNP